MCCELEICCGRCDSERRVRELDQRLFTLFKSWEVHVLALADGRAVSKASLVEEFFANMHERLPQLLQQEKEELEGITGKPG
jgi:hypothetical protein